MIAAKTPCATTAVGMCCPKGMVFAPWPEKRIDFAHFGLESGMVFERTQGSV